MMIRNRRQVGACHLGGLAMKSLLLVTAFGCGDLVPEAVSEVDTEGRQATKDIMVALELGEADLITVERTEEGEKFVSAISNGELLASGFVERSVLRSKLTPSFAGSEGLLEKGNPSSGKGNFYLALVTYHRSDLHSELKQYWISNSKTNLWVPSNHRHFYGKHRIRSFALRRKCEVQFFRDGDHAGKYGSNSRAIYQRSLPAGHSRWNDLWVKCANNDSARAFLYFNNNYRDPMLPAWEDFDLPGPRWSGRVRSVYMETRKQMVGKDSSGNYSIGSVTGDESQLPGDWYSARRVEFKDGSCYPYNTCFASDDCGPPRMFGSISASQCENFETLGDFDVVSFCSGGSRSTCTTYTRPEGD